MIKRYPGGRVAYVKPKGLHDVVKPATAQAARDLALAESIAHLSRGTRQVVHVVGRVMDANARREWARRRFGPR